MTELLRLENVTAGYGEAVVIDDLSLAMNEGDSLALLGRNGVGKSTLLCTLMGLTSLHRGRLSWLGGDLGKMPAFQRAHAGLGWVPQERGIFPSLTVEENLTSIAKTGGRWTLKDVYRIFPRLQERRTNMGNQLSGGEQQMLAIGRALLIDPKLLLLDEPMEGLAPIIVQELMGVIRDLIRQSGIAVIVVEQHARLALGLTQKAVVLSRGKVIHQSDSASLMADKDLLTRLVAVG